MEILFRISFIRRCHVNEKQKGINYFYSGTGLVGYCIIACYRQLTGQKCIGLCDVTRVTKGRILFTVAVVIK